MKRILITAALTTLTVVSVAPGIQAAARAPRRTGASTAPPRTSPGVTPLGTRVTVTPSRALLRSFVCERALDPPARAISITAVMRPLARTRRLQMSFTLLQRPPGASIWSAVVGPHLGVWVSPSSPPTLGRRPGDVWKVPFPVADLAAPASYRLQVSFRWLGRRGAVLATATKLTRGCWQPELRPALSVSSPTVTQDSVQAGYEVFGALVRNIGATAAGPFDVQLTYTHNQQSITDTRHVVRLYAHSMAGVTIDGPWCDPGSAVSLTADPAHLLDVYTRTGSTVTIVCPALPAGTP